MKGQFERIKDSPSKHEIRVAFLEEMGRIEPEVLRSLYKKVFSPHIKIFPLDKEKIYDIEDQYINQTYKKSLNNLSPLGFSDGLARKNWKLTHEDLSYWYGFEGADENNYPELIGIREATISWSQQWNLDADWCRDWAINIITGEWEYNTGFSFEDWLLRGGVENLVSSWGITLAINEDEEKKLLPSKSFPRWEPACQEREIYLNELEKKVEKIINADPILSIAESSIRRAFIASIMDKARRYCKELEKYYSSHPAWKKNKSIKELSRNINWAVQFQIQKIPFTKIAKTEMEEPPTVKRAVDEILTIIHLQPRKDAKPGRTKGAKDSVDCLRQIEKNKRTRIGS